jgi:ATP-dependent DNA helicase RecG
MAERGAITWEAPVTVLRGVGPERAEVLLRLGIQTVGDLVLHRPLRHEDRRSPCRIRDLVPQSSALVQGSVVAAGVKRWRHGAKSVFELVLEDGTGRLHCRWWNMPYLESQYSVGDVLLVFGKVGSGKPVSMDHPETETLEEGEGASLHVGRIVPVYPLTEGIQQRGLRGLVWQALQGLGDKLPDPRSALDVGDLPTHAEALRFLHFPEAPTQPELARQRLALDELLELQLEFQSRRRRLETVARGLPCGGDNRLIRPFLAGLPFTLTEGQVKVLREILSELSGAHPMRRLLQGDVGVGKTVVAACSALMALESGFSVALMVPTEVLAEQHWQRFLGWFAPLGVRMALLTSSRKVVPVPEVPGVATVEPCLTIGTHALLEDGYAPSRLGLVLIDEQHKFGVVQRETLVRKGEYPHLLVMTATPIPRTLGLTLYGDLEVSVLEGGPGGRGSLRTFVRDSKSLPKIYDFVKMELQKGRQAYLVYPRVEDGDLSGGGKAVMQEVEALKQAFAPHTVGLLHGRLSAEQKETAMRDFTAGRIAVLAATTVIEVGLDVPNATVMLVQNADSFGLAQLHQLRGRIGRGGHDSYCILVAESRTREARERLAVLEKTHDGFAIAEEDLRLRGPGEFLGQQQSGVPNFRFADLRRDWELVCRAKQLAPGCLVKAG